GWRVFMVAGREDGSDCGSWWPGSGALDACQAVRLEDPFQLSLRRVSFEDMLSGSRAQRPADLRVEREPSRLRVKVLRVVKASNRAISWQWRSGIKDARGGLPVVFIERNQGPVPGHIGCEHGLPGRHGLEHRVGAALGV